MQLVTFKIKKCVYVPPGRLKVMLFILELKSSIDQAVGNAVVFSQPKGVDCRQI